MSTQLYRLIGFFLFFMLLVLVIRVWEESAPPPEVATIEKQVDPLEDERLALETTISIRSNQRRAYDTTKGTLSIVCIDGVLYGDMAHPTQAPSPFALFNVDGSIKTCPGDFYEEDL